MSGNFDSEQWQNFNHRLSHWISRQGFWFQLRHSLRRSGRNEAFAFHFFQLSFRLILFVLVGGAAWVGVVKFMGDEKFSKGLGEVLGERFAADEMEIRGVNRGQGNLTISRLALFAKEESFFTGLELSNLICKRDFLVDFGGDWDTEVVQISRVNLSLRAGADSEEGSKSIADVLFQDLGEIRPHAILVGDMTMRWGYNERSRGSIRGSRMKAVPLKDGWRLSFVGGTFSQNWLKQLQIQELEVEITREGIRFEKAVFVKNGGTLVLEEFSVESGQRPVVSGRVKIRGLDISTMIPMVARAYVEGRISGELKVSGSTNSTEGIGFDGVIELDEGDVITVRDRVPLLKSLSVVDAVQTYRKVDFRTGSLRMEMGEKGLTISDVRLFADDLMGLSGGMLVRKPKSDEELVLDDGSEFFGEILRKDEMADDFDITLRDAGEVSRQFGIGFQSDADKSLFGKLEVLRENRRIREIEAEKLSRSYRYEGQFQISLMRTAFDRAPELAELYPASAESGRLELDVPIKGLLYELTADLAKELYEKGGR